MSEPLFQAFGLAGGSQFIAKERGNITMRNHNFFARSVALAGMAAILAVPTVSTAQTASTGVLLAPATTPTQTATLIVAPVEAPATPAVVVAAPAVPVKAELPMESAIVLTPVAEITTKKLKAGDRVELVTMGNVSHNGIVVVPAGTRAYATVTDAAGRAAFGRGGEMKMKFDALSLADGRVINLTGSHTETGARQDTQGAANLGQTGAALAGSFGAVGALVGLLGRAAVTGRSAVIKPGAKLKAFTAQAFYYGKDGAGDVAAKSDAAEPAAITLPGAASTGANK
jgi:hypothetical protein